MFIERHVDDHRISHLRVTPENSPEYQREKNDHLTPSAGAEINLAAVDLNLLVALEALLQLRNVTHAGRRIGLSQPAMSRALSRLRALFNDDLLVRTPRGLTLTIRGEQLLDKLPEALGLLRNLVSGRDAVESRMKSRITVAMPEHQSVVLLPQLLPRLLEKEPELDLVLHDNLMDAVRGLEDGLIDFVVGPRQEAYCGFYARTLYSDRPACLLRQDHPALEKPWSNENLRDLRHAVLAGHGDAGSPTAWEQQPERSPLVVPNLSAATSMIANTDLALVVPSRAAHVLAANSSLVVREMPDELQEAEVALLWHERCHRDPRHRWMRAQFAAAAICH